MKVGFIGLGNVGAKLSGSLLRNGVNLTIHDLDDARVSDFVARGATRGESPSDLMENCDIVITCLPSPTISAAVVDQMLPHVCEGKIWLEMSTTDEAEVKRLGNMVIERGGAAVDCPVSGGCHRADTGNISILQAVIAQRLKPCCRFYNHGTSYFAHGRFGFCQCFEGDHQFPCHREPCVLAEALTLPRGRHGFGCRL